ncbi:MAG: flagellar biosynthesis protein FliQ [Clostridia bacterium]|nr:flagellar biosynthesis protein FliQ [Clostridia bacterium]MBR3810070.1 flagellar biosynthesis protein FliQ [Clostridia bacterium]
MTQEDALVIFRESILLIIKLVSPMLIISVGVGLVIAIFQAATQIHEQTLSFAPKILIIGVILIVGGSWMIANIQEFFEYIMSYMAGL